MDLVGGAALVGTEHDDVGRGVGELLGVEGLVVLEELHVGTTALEAGLELDLVLDNEGVVLVVDGLGELGGNGVMSSLVLDNKTLIALNTLEDSGLLDSPVANVRPLLIVGLDVLLCVRGLPSGLPIVCELLKEGSFQCGGLRYWLV